MFSLLATLTMGADVIVVLGDGTRIQFSVGAKGSWLASAHPSGLFSGDGPPRLSLITCTGGYDRSSQTYAERLIVEAGYVGLA
ncbi:MAG TPA: class F sortase [Candidatus Nanopelagicaceae bacterium]|nr:class F sortase [Candidatus Nanopelagicaceae bacterium]